MSTFRKYLFMKIFLLSIFPAIFVLSVAENVFSIMTTEPVLISVDASQNLGEKPDVLKAGMMGYFSDDFSPLKSELAGLNAKPFWRFHLGFGIDCPGGNSDIKPINFEEDFKKWLYKEVNPNIKKYQDAGSQIIISLSQIPKWLSLYPLNECLPKADKCFLKWTYSPPKDYTEWKNLLKLFVSTQKNDGINADYIIGDEPDWMFYGLEDQYLEFFSHSVKAIKEVDRNIKVGALGVSNWANEKYKNCPSEATGLKDGECPPKDHTMIQTLINYVSKNKVDLDFIDWHFPNNLVNEVNTTKSWLKGAGMLETLPLTIGEWVFSPKREEESTEKASAFAIHLLKTMMDNGIKRHTATAIYNQPGWYSGDWAHVGFFSFDGVIKTKWNAFKAIDKLSGHRIKAETTDEDNVIAISFKENEKLAVLASNFITPEELAIEAAIDSFSDQSDNFVQTCFQKKNLSMKEFFVLNKLFFMDQVTIYEIENIFIHQCNSFPDYLKNDFINSNQIAHQVYNGQLSYQPHPREVELKIKNIDPGVYNYKKYIIDGDMTEIHSNPCRYNKKTESSPSNTECGANGALKQAINQANYDSNNAKMNYLLSIGYQQNNVDQYMNCSNNPNCDTDSLINDYCQQNPILCPKIKNDLMEAQELSDYLFYHGSYTGTDGKTYTIPIYVDQINHSKEVSLEGSKKEKQVTLTDSTFTENFMMQPYSVVLLEISLFLPTPIIPNGPTNGATHNSYTYSTSGSTSILVQPVEYQFDWKGDGTDLSPWGPDTQSKTWTSPGTYMVKARARYATNTSVVSGWSSGLLVTIDGISIISPNGGENWKAGTTQTISWIFKGNIGDYIKIELLKGGTGNSTITFRTSIGNGESGSYSWRIPKFKTPGSDYTLRITSTSNNYYSDASDNFFTISK